MKILSAALAALLFVRSAGIWAFSAASEKTLLPILMYHHISTDSSRLGDYVVSPETLEGDLKWLSERGYSAVSLAQLRDYANGGELPEKCVMISFDDGQLSFSEYALPLLEKYDMCAIIAIVGSYADEFTASGDKNPSYAYMDWDEIARLDAHPRVETAAHSYNMHDTRPRLGCAPLKGEGRNEYRRVLYADIGKLNRRFGERLGHAPRAFVYPFGQYSAMSEEALRAAGYLFTFTCEERVNEITRNEDSFFRLGRFNRPNFINRADYFAKLGIT